MTDIEQNFRRLILELKDKHNLSYKQIIRRTGLNEGRVKNAGSKNPRSYKATTEDVRKLEHLLDEVVTGRQLPPEAEVEKAILLETGIAKKLEAISKKLFEKLNIIETKIDQLQKNDH